MHLYIIHSYARKKCYAYKIHFAFLNSVCTKQIYATKLQTSNLHHFSINKMLLTIVEQEIV